MMGKRVAGEFVPGKVRGRVFHRPLSNQLLSILTPASPSRVRHDPLVFSYIVVVLDFLPCNLAPLHLCMVDHGDHGFAIKTRYRKYQNHLKDILPSTHYHKFRISLNNLFRFVIILSF
jgi:hypothetical protein